MSKKFFVIADVHSFYDEMQVALNTAKFDIDNPDHVLISCGDALDRGPKSMEVLEFLMSVPKERRIFIRGNHEDLLEDCIKRRGFVLQDLSNGTLKTIFAVMRSQSFTTNCRTNQSCDIQTFLTKSNMLSFCGIIWPNVLTFVSSGSMCLFTLGSQRHLLIGEKQTRKNGAAPDGAIRLNYGASVTEFLKEPWSVVIGTRPMITASFTNMGRSLATRPALIFL